MNEVKQKAGSLGGCATFEKYGRQHMVDIGKEGARVLWERYQLLPYQTRGWALKNKQTGEIKAVWG